MVAYKCPLCIPNVGIPLMHIVSNTIVLESPTRLSQKAHDEVGCDS